MDNEGIKLLLAAIDKKPEIAAKYIDLTITIFEELPWPTQINIIAKMAQHFNEYMKKAKSDGDPSEVHKAGDAVTRSVKK